MIAIDASTAIQSFRDNAYDIKELGVKIKALLTESKWVLFKYADGSVLAFPSAALVRSVMASFDRLVIGGSVVLEPSSGALLVHTTEGEGTLEAIIGVHEAQSLDISDSHISALSVSSSLSVTDISAWASAHNMSSYTITANSAQIQKADATQVSGGSQKLSVYVPTPSDSSVAASTKSMRVVSEMGQSPLYSSAGLVEPNEIGLWATADVKTEKIVLQSESMSLYLPSREASSVTVSITCTIPYHTSTGWEYLTVDSYEVDRGDTARAVAAKGAMVQFLLYPRWNMAGDATSFRTFQVLPGESGANGPAPIIRVENRSSSTLELPHVWSFGKTGDGKGTVTVAHKVKIGGYSCKEFEFRHNAANNCAYMYPLSLWY